MVTRASNLRSSGESQDATPPPPDVSRLGDADPPPVRAENAETLPSQGGEVHLGDPGTRPSQYACGTLVNRTSSDNYVSNSVLGQAVDVSPRPIGVIYNSILASNDPPGGAGSHPIDENPMVPYTDLRFPLTQVCRGPVWASSPETQSSEGTPWAA